MTITERFYEFHRANPHVYKTLVLLARQYRRKHGRDSNVGIAMLWEKMRWDFLMSTEHSDFKLNNNHKALYARLVMAAEPDLEGIFETRERRAA